MIIRPKIIATVEVFYWMPDYEHILQEFRWQTTDIKPDYPRIQKFLSFWHDNVDAVISEVNIYG